ncbi:hypothetical protein PQX77_020723 [Marasmius sp. AFHP31]|nr:hypothetical protein PQX77_020723 [Marasmius sp. AFHP31]
MFSQFLHKARNFQITGSTFNQVQGDQYNSNYTTTIVQAKEEEPSEFDEYFKVKLGGIFKLRDVGSSAYPRRWDNGDRYWPEQGKPRSDKTICTARVLEQPGMVFTILQYSGPDAHRAFLKDFRMLSNTVTSNASQIYGYSKSSIPSLILYNDLVPALQLALNGIIGTLGLMYLGNIVMQLGCNNIDELWIDTGREMFCRGPPGPAFYTRYYWYWFGDSELPLTAELVRSDVLPRFAASLKSKEVDRCINDSHVQQASDVDARLVRLRVSQPAVISALTNTPIAVATNNAWKSGPFDDLLDRKVLENGLTRFTLNGSPRYIALRWNENVDDAWMSQAWSIFHDRGVTLEDDLSLYYLVYPWAWLRVSDFWHESEAEHKQQSQQPIYLFVRLPPSDLQDCETSSLHYWSFDEDGRSPLPPDTCHGLGLPNELKCESNFRAICWTNEHYQNIHQYQVLRGFDPSTTDFARHIRVGYEYDDILFQPANDSDRFQIHQGLLHRSHHSDIACLTFSNSLAGPPPESRPSTLISDIEDIEDSEEFALFEPILRSAATGTRPGSTSFWSPVFLPSATEVLSELATTMETLNLDVD